MTKSLYLRMASFMFGTVILFSCVSAKPNPSKSLKDFVDKTELKCDSYSSDEWERNASQYEKLVEQYVTSDREYTETEKQVAAKAMGRYHSLLIKYGIEKSASVIKELGEILPSYLEGLASGIDENSESIESALKNLFDEEKLDKSLESLERTLDGLFESVE